MTRRPRTIPSDKEPPQQQTAVTSALHFKKYPLGVRKDGFLQKYYTFLLHLHPMKDIYSPRNYLMPYFNIDILSIHTWVTKMSPHSGLTWSWLRSDQVSVYFGPSLLIAALK